MSNTERFLISWHGLPPRAYGGPGDGFQFVNYAQIRTISHKNIHIIGDYENQPFKDHDGMQFVFQLAIHSGYYKMEKERKDYFPVYYKKRKKRR